MLLLNYLEPLNNLQVSLFSPFVGGAMEAKVAGAAFGVKKGKISKPVEGATGVL